MHLDCAYLNQMIARLFHIRVYSGKTFGLGAGYNKVHGEGNKRMCAKYVSSWFRA
jgi:hypothetical protein